MQQEFVPSHGVAQILIRGIVCLQAVRASLVDRIEIIPAALFGFVHRGVGLIHQVLRVWAATGVVTQTSAQIETEPVALMSFRRTSGLFTNTRQFCFVSFFEHCLIVGEGENAGSRVMLWNAEQILGIG